ncbi:hypothetical protein [Mesorhizobium prunaredense]|nr:hypothetical protein [Mesorhizobium prunaredense]
MTTAKPLDRNSAIEGALASGVATAELSYTTCGDATVTSASSSKQASRNRDDRWSFKTWKD